MMAKKQIQMQNAEDNEEELKEAFKVKETYELLDKQ